MTSTNIVQPIDLFIARANSSDVALVLNQAKHGQEFTSNSYKRLIQSISDMFDSMSNSSSSLILELLNASDIASKKAIALTLVRAKLPLANVELRSSVAIVDKTTRLEERLLSAETELSVTKTDLERVRENLQREIDDLRAQLEFALEQNDDDEDDNDDDDDNDKENHANDHFLTDPKHLYITRHAWAQAIRYIEIWRLSRKDDVQDATDFIEWLSVRRLEEPGATAVMKLLQHATDFDADWIDPILSIKGATPPKTYNLLRAASAISRDQDIISVTNTFRESTMTHVVYSQIQWPLVIAALRLFGSEHWGKGPFLFLRWLNADEKRRQLLALISHGDTIASDNEKAALTDQQQEYFELVMQQASDQRELNLYDFIPVARETVVAQLSDALKILDEELPKLMADVKPTELQDTKAYADILQRLKQMRKQLAVDWLERLSRQALTELIDQSMLNDTEKNRGSIVDMFYQLLHELDTEKAVQIKWII